jgi:hypothetical protein
MAANHLQKARHRLDGEIITASGGQRRHPEVRPYTLRRNPGQQRKLAFYCNINVNSEVKISDQHPENEVNL